MRFRTIASLFNHASRRHARAWRTPAPAHVAPIAEAVEARVLLASFSPFIVGAGSVLRGDEYEVNLGNAGSEPVTSWTVNWGDGTSSTFNDTPLTTRATHVYTENAERVVTATASSATRTNVSAGGLALDPSFDGDGKVASDVSAGADYGYAMALQPDGKIVMAGWVGSDFGLIRFNADGSRDMTFDDQQLNDGLVQIQLGTATDRAYAIALDSTLDPSNPRIVVAGSAGGDFALVRLNSDGTLDSTFNGTGKQIVNLSNGSATDEALAVTVRQSDGAIVAAGYAQGQFAAAKFNPDGSIDTSFSGDGKAYVDFTPDFDCAQAVVLQSNDKILLGGRTMDQGSGGGTDAHGNPIPRSNYSFLLARLNGDGTLDDDSDGDGFGGDGKVMNDIGLACGWSIYDSDYSLVLDEATDNIVAAGNVTDASSGRNNFVVSRFLPNGSFDTSFGGTGRVETDFRSNTDDAAYAVRLQPDGKLVVAGVSRGPSTTESRQDFALIRYTATGALDTTFGTGGKVWSDFGGTNSEDVARSLEVDPDGRIIVAGCAGSSFALARYLPTNKLIIEIPPQPQTPGPIWAVNAAATQVNLEWPDNPESSVTYRVYRGTSPTFVPEASNQIAVSLAVSALIDIVPSAGTYYYAVTAVRGQVESGIGFSDAVDTTQMPELPFRPQLTTTPSAGFIHLTWSDVLEEQGYRLERSADGGVTWPQVWQFGTNVTSYSDSSTQPEVLYQYRVRAYNAAGNTAFSEIALGQLPESWGITAYMPPVESAPDVVVSDADEEAYGLTMRPNDSADAGNLVRVVLKRWAADATHTLDRTTANINVWADAQMTAPLLGNNGILSIPLTFTGATMTVWVEWRADAADPSETALELRAQPAAPGTPAPKPDRVRIEATETLVVLISGHTQNGSNDEDPNTKPEDPSQGSGMRKLEQALRHPQVKLTNVKLWSEDPGNKGPLAFSNVQLCGGGAPDEGEILGGHAKVIYNDIVKYITDANNHGKLPNIALVGYSHGGGLVFLIASLLADKWLNDVQFDYHLTFTGYIDAIKHPNGIDPFSEENGLLTPETRIPPRTEYHVNYCQTHDRGVNNEPNGALMQGFPALHENIDLDWPKESIDHGGKGGIHQDDMVLKGELLDAEGRVKWRGIMPHMKAAHGIP
jgi:uncharacterized delta-60 repeat protein